MTDRPTQLPKQLDEANESEEEMAHAGLPRPDALALRKLDLLETLRRVDGDKAASDRALAMETDFRTRITSHIQSLPTADAKFANFNTSPFVLMFYALQHGYTRISEMEEAILPAKVFSSMETSAGRMIEAVVLPKYGWEFAPSGMHTVNSAIDGKKNHWRHAVPSNAKERTALLE
ncbi:MAG: hypothetical protein JNL96_13855 [Planctomycetaceae bacterium]|nr:hypothetical protein [Planctomycetaceae bacterium]